MIDMKTANRLLQACFKVCLPPLVTKWKGEEQHRFSSLQHTIRVTMVYRKTKLTEKWMRELLARYFKIYQQKLNLFNSGLQESVVTCRLTLYIPLIFGAPSSPQDTFETPDLTTVKDNTMLSTTAYAHKLKN